MTGLRMLVGAWCIFCWLVGSMLGVFALDACDYTDPATCDRAMNTDLPIFTAAQLLVLVVALVFSSPRRRPRTHAMALTLGGSRQLCSTF
jgi:hypothetical protein